MVDVFRPAESVFDKDTIHSFEGKAFVDQHPEGGQFVTPDNIERLQRGHIQNVRKGTEPLDSGDWPLIADIVITHPDVIQKVENGLRNLSCGYGYNLAHRDGKVLQVDIVGNHVALVPRGRAGAEARINDAAPEGTKAAVIIPKKEHHVSNRLLDLLGLGLKAKAADANTSPEELAEAAKEVGKATTAEGVRKGEDRTDDAHVDEFEREEKPKGDPERERMHAALDRVLNKRAKDRKADDCRAEDTDIPELRKLLDEFLGEEEAEPEHEAADAETEEELEEEEEKDGEAADKGKACDVLVIPVGTGTRKPVARAADAAGYEQGKRDGMAFALNALKPHVARAMRSGGKEGSNLARAFDTVATSLNLAAKRDGKGSYADFGRSADQRSQAAKDAINNHGRAADRASEQTPAERTEAVNKMYASRHRKSTTEVK